MNGKQMAGTVIETVLKVLVSIVIVLFVYDAAVSAYDYGYRIFAEEPVAIAPGRDISVTITDGKNAKEIGEILEAKGLIRDAKLFHIQNMLSGYKDELRTGVYVLNTSMTSEEMMAIMAAVPEEETDDN